MTTIRIQPPMIDVPKGKHCGVCDSRKFEWCYSHQTRLNYREVTSGRTIIYEKCPACLAACAEAEKIGTALPMKDWIDEAKINPELVITQLFAKFEIEISILRAKLAKRDEALWWYADKRNWRWGALDKTHIEIDHGQRAREALEDKK